MGEKTGIGLTINGIPRATGDLDIWISMEPGNALRVFRALVAFGAPVDALNITPADFETPGRVVQLGIPPRRIDVLNEISGVVFEESWPERLMGQIGELTVAFLGRETLIKNKIASGRPKDVADVAAIQGNE